MLLSSLDLFFLFHLLVQELLLQFLVLSGAVVVGRIFPDDEGNSRAQLGLLKGGVFSVIGFLSPLHLSRSPLSKYYSVSFQTHPSHNTDRTSSLGTQVQL